MAITVGFGPTHNPLSEPWNACLPGQFPSDAINGWGTDAASCQADFVAAYNAKIGETASMADFEWVRNVAVSAYQSTSDEGVTCWGDPGDRDRITVTRSTEDEARADFIATWNTEMGTDFEPVEFGFTDAS